MIGGKCKFCRTALCGALVLANPSVTDGRLAMTIVPRRLRAALLSYAFGAATILAAGPIGAASAQSSGVELPTYRQLGASEPMASAGVSGSDASANPPSLAGLSLLATIPAANSPRRGYFIEAQCTAGLTVAFDDQAGTVMPTIVVLAGPSSNGGQGGALDMSSMPHTGRIRIYSSSPTCQMAARSW